MKKPKWTLASAIQFTKEQIEEIEKRFNVKVIVLPENKDKKNLKKEIKPYPLWKDVKVSGLSISGKYLWATKIKKYTHFFPMNIYKELFVFN